MSPTELTLEVSGRRTRVLRGGEGPPLLFLHSGLGEAWWLSWCEQLAETRTVYVPSHPGFAGSEDKGIDDVEDLAFHYDELFGLLGLDTLVLVGQSLGGWVAAEYAVRWPHRIDRLVLVDAAGLRVEGAPVTDMWMVRPPELAGLLFADTSGPIPTMLRSFDAESLPDESVLTAFIGSQAATARLAWNPYLHNPKLAGRLRRIESPTLVLWGSDDRLIPFAHAEAYAELIPDSRVRTVPGAGHLPLVERPEATAGAIRDFLA